MISEIVVSSRSKDNSLTNLLEVMEDDSIRRWIPYDNRHGQRCRSGLPYKLNELKKRKQPAINNLIRKKPPSTTKRVQKMCYKSRGRRDLDRDLKRVTVYGPAPLKTYQLRSRAK